MNPGPHFRSNPRTVLVASVVLAVVVGGAEPTVIRSVESVNVAATDDRTQVLFLGTLLKVKDEAGGWHQINAAQGKRFAEQRTGQGAAPVDIKPGAFEFTYDRALKLAAGRIELSAFEAVPSFSPARDPGRRWLQAQSLAASGAMDQARSANLRAGAEVAVGRSLQSVASDPNLSAAQKEQSTRDIEGSSASQTSVDASIPVLEMGDDVEVDGRERDLVRTGDRETERNVHDAVEIGFTLNAEQDLAQPCVLVYAEFQVPGAVRRHRRVFVEALPPLKQGVSRNVRLRKYGFPAGFTDLSVQVSFFDQGLELVTNEAERRTPLTRAEARQFAVLEHLSRHRDLGQPAGAELVRELVDDALRKAWARLGRRCYVQVNPEGEGEAAFEDAMGQHPLAEPELLGLIAKLAFRPAVTPEGEAIAGMVPLSSDGL